jgi:hypothetical protein
MNWYKNGAIFLFIILVLGILGSFCYKVEGFQGGGYSDYYKQLIADNQSGYTGLGYTAGSSGYTGVGGYRDKNTDNYDIIYYGPNGFKVQIINANNTYGLILTSTDGKVITYSTNDPSSYGKPLVYMVPKTFYGSDGSYAVVDIQNDIYTITVTSTDGSKTVYTKEGQGTTVTSGSIDMTPSPDTLTINKLSGSDGSNATIKDDTFIVTTKNGDNIIYKSTNSTGMFYGPNGSIAIWNSTGNLNPNIAAKVTTSDGQTVEYTFPNSLSNVPYTATAKNQQQQCSQPPSNNYIETPYSQPPMTPEQYAQNTLKQENLYILKTKIVPLVCPSCQMITTNKSGSGQCKKCQISTESKYGYDTDNDLPSPNLVVKDYTTYGT